LESKIFQEIAESYLNNQLVILKNLSAKIDFPFIADFAKETESFLLKKHLAIKTKKDLIAFQNIIDTLDEINGIFIRTTDESTYWVMPLIKELYKFLSINIEEREILIVSDSKVSYLDGGYGVIVDLFNNKNIAKLEFPSTKKIDVFFLPQQSNFSISSIAILAHEIGHVFFNIQKDIQSDIVSQIINQLTEDKKTITLFSNPHEKLRRTNLSSHIEEYFCDIMGYYLLGPVFSFASIKILGLIDDDDLTYTQGTHPPVFKRLYNAKQQFVKFLSALNSKDKIYAPLTTIKQRYFDDLYLIPPVENDVTEDDQYFIDLSNNVAQRVFSKYLKKQNLFEPPAFTIAYEKSLDNLNKLIPLIETTSAEKPQSINPWELLVATVLYFYGNIYEAENTFYNTASEGESRRESLKNILINFIKYSTNLYSFYDRVKTSLPEKMAGKNTVWNLRARGGAGDPFIVVPTIDFERQYSTNAVDLRLGNTFITSKLTEFTHIPTRPSLNKNVEYFFEKHFIPFNKDFTLHPHNFVLAVTLEYICIPVDYYALVLGRSTWGRLGLNIATATAVGPGFKGCITLELRNLSEVPITLNIGTRICQICLIKNPIENANVPAYYLNKNKYICPTEVEYPKIHLDPDWDLLKKFTP
jgi:dCTP deaminase